MQGPLQLWNIRTGKQLYWFKGFGSSVTCIQQAPALDVCAIGLSNGDVYIHNLKFDKTLIHLVHDAGPVSAMSFYSASNAAADLSCFNHNQIVASDDQEIKLLLGSSTGQLSCWVLPSSNNDQNKTGISCQRSQLLHFDRIASLHVISSGPAAGALVSLGADNCVKVSYFDRPDGGLRTVYRRCGHFLPPTKLAFWPGETGDGSLLLSAGNDSVLRIFSTFNDSLDKSLGRAYAPGCPDRRKASSDQRSQWLLPPPTSVSLSPHRANDWDSLVSLHAGRRQASSWNFANAKRGKHWFDPNELSHNLGRYKRAYASCVFVTNCGNFVLIGYSTGHLFRFNMQSGLEQGSYGDPLAHDGVLVGACSENVNRQVISCSGRLVKFWSFYSHKPAGSLDLTDGSASLTRFHIDSDLLAIALDSGHILLVDVNHRCVIRRFANPDSNLCSDLAFSSDASWIVTSHHGDPLIKTWDTVDGTLIDCFRVSTPVSSLAFSPTGDLLATTHLNELGVCLWDNSSLYKPRRLDPLPPDFAPPVTKEGASVPLPCRSLTNFQSSGELPDDDELRTDDNDDNCEMDIDQSVESFLYKSPLQLPINNQSEPPLTISGIKPALLTSLLHLDAVRDRNRQAVASKSTSSTASNDLPFFLPIGENVHGGLEREPVATNNDSSFTKGSKRRALDDDSVIDQRWHNDVTLTQIESNLSSSTTCDEGMDKAQADRLMLLLASLGPSRLDLLLRCMGPDPLIVAANQTTDDSTSQSPPHDSTSDQTILPPSESSFHRFNTFLAFLNDRYVLSIT